MFFCTSGWGCNWDICCISEGEREVEREREGAKRWKLFCKAYFKTTSSHPQNLFHLKNSWRMSRKSLISKIQWVFYVPSNNCSATVWRIWCVTHCPSAIILFPLTFMIHVIVSAYNNSPTTQTQCVFFLCVFFVCEEKRMVMNRQWLWPILEMILKL